MGTQPILCHQLLGVRLSFLVLAFMYHQAQMDFSCHNLLHVGTFFLALPLQSANTNMHGVHGLRRNVLGQSSTTELRDDAAHSPYTV